MSNLPKAILLIIYAIVLYITYRPAKSFQPLESHYYWNSSDYRRYPWIKFCDNHGQHEIQPGYQCSKGVHVPGGFQPGCVCPYGL